MIHVTSQKHRTRRSATSARGERLVVELSPEGIYLREHGRRFTVLVPYGAAYQYGVELEVARRKRAKAAAKKERRKTLATTRSGSSGASRRLG